MTVEACPMLYTSIPCQFSSMTKGLLLYEQSASLTILNLNSFSKGAGSRMKCPVTNTNTNTSNTAAQRESGRFPRPLGPTHTGGALGLANGCIFWCWSGFVLGFYD